MGKGGKVVHLLSSPSGHLLLPLDDKVTVSSESAKHKTLVFHNDQVMYTIEGDDVIDDSLVEVPEPPSSE